MPCYRPLKAYKMLNEYTKNGKNVIEFQKEKAGKKAYEKVTLACGQCIGCKIDRSASWAIRCVHEAQLYSENSFITLTFNDKNINQTQTLMKVDFQKFMKRLRKHEKGKRIRYFHCGEYGQICGNCGKSKPICLQSNCKTWDPVLGRPHHHACLFGHSFNDVKLIKQSRGVKLYTSQTLAKLWPFGYVTIGDVTYESAAYVARYIHKKINGPQKEGHYTRTDRTTGETVAIEPEYITMSRRPGIGKAWFQQYSSDVYPKDFVTVKGKKFRAPHYYDRLYESMEPGRMQKIKNKRKENALKEDPKEKMMKRQRVKETVAKRCHGIRERKFENDTSVL